MHRKALTIARIAKVTQIIRPDGELVNEFRTIVGSVPFVSDYSGGLPVEIEGCITSTGVCEEVDGEGEDRELRIGMKSVKIRCENG